MRTKPDLMSQISFKNRIKSQTRKTLPQAKTTNVAQKTKPDWNFFVNDLEKYKMNDSELVWLLAPEENCTYFKKQATSIRRIPPTT
jgi:hypothetical protein